jgi:hypothetical protein
MRIESLRPGDSMMYLYMLTACFLLMSGCPSNREVRLDGVAQKACLEDAECVAVDAFDICRGSGGCPDAAIHRDDLEKYETAVVEYDGQFGCDVDFGAPPDDGYAPDCVAKAECLEGFCALVFDR